MCAEAVNWDPRPESARLVDWDVASRVGARLSGSTSVSQLERARIVEDFGELIPRAEELVVEFTQLVPQGYRARPWVMNRMEWIDANLRGFQRVIEPLAIRVFEKSGDAGSGTAVRRKALGLQVGLLMGYVSRKVLGQYDLFLPPDDEGMLYFVGPNVATTERRFRFPPRDFRMWISLHEVTHRVQFGAVSWLRPFLLRQVDTYLSSVDLDPKRVFAVLKKAVEEVRNKSSKQDLIMLLMTPEQRQIVERIQGLMSLLEGHANFVMDNLGEEHVDQAARMRRALQERRKSSGLEKTFQRVIGFDAKVRQYDIGERFVSHIVERAGMEGFNRIWSSEDNLPSLAEVSKPDDWLARVHP